MSGMPAGFHGLLYRWLAAVRAGAQLGAATRVTWGLDGRTTRWPGGLSPGDLYRGVTGLDSEVAPILWSRADSGEDGRRGFMATGVLRPLELEPGRRWR
jgi:hypothetical protein